MSGKILFAPYFMHERDKEKEKREIQRVLRVN